MAKRSQYHVTKSNRGGWDVKKSGSKAPVSSHRKKETAVESGRRRARSEGNSQLVIHGQNGKIQTENSYGNDPYPPKG